MPRAGADETMLNALRKTRVVVVEGQLLLRKAMRGLLESEGGIEVVADAATVEEALADGVEVDLVVVDLDDFVGDFDATMRTIAPRLRGARLCGLTAHARPEAMQRCLAAGVDGYVAKDVSPGELLRAIALVAGGAPYVDPRVAGGLLRRKSAARRSESRELSTREGEIVRLIAVGLSNREISERLGLSEKTIKNHISRIFSKLRIVARTQAAVYAIRAGLV